MSVSHRCSGCGRRSSVEQLRRDLYLGQRTIGDMQALSRGRIGRRLIRRSVTRSLMKALWR